MLRLTMLQIMLVCAVVLLLAQVRVVAAGMACPRLDRTQANVSFALYAPESADVKLYGYALQFIGDLDNNGFSDLVVGDHYHNTAMGQITIEFMGANDERLSSTVLTNAATGSYLSAWDYYGSSLAALGDLNGDSVPDLAVGAYGSNTAAGSIYIRFMTSTAGVLSTVEIGHGMGGLTSTIAASANCGYSMDAIGDLDGDTHPEIAVGCWGDSIGGVSRAGRVIIISLETTGTVKWDQSIYQSTGGLTNSLGSDYFFGSAVAGLGDLNGDDIPDIAVASDGYILNGVWSLGAYFILHMNSDGTIQQETVIGPGEGGMIGANLDSGSGFADTGAEGVGDIDGDGIPDLAVGTRTKQGFIVLFMNSDGTVREEEVVTNSYPWRDAATFQNFGASIAYDDTADWDDNYGLPKVYVGGWKSSLTGGFWSSVTLKQDCICSGNQYGEFCELDCLHGGVFLNATHCNCTGTGFDGVNCADDVDDCASMPCNNSGICTDTGLFNYTCDCSNTRYTGAHCNIEVNPCDSNPCVNNGTCSPGVSDLWKPSYAVVNPFTCDCNDTGSTGEFCEVDIDDCASNACGANGVCTDLGANMFSCNCTEDHWSGEFCEVYDYCADEPCQNNATCTTTTTTSSDYTCNCTGTGFTGELCDVDVDDCSSNACYVNGTSSCFDLGVNLYECKCFTGFSGDYCEVDNNIYTVDNNNTTNNNNNNTNVTTVLVVDTTFCASSPCVTTTALCVNDTCDCRGLNTGEFCEIGVPSEIVLLVVIPLDAFESTDDVLASLPVLLASETGLLEEQFEVVLLDASSGSYEVTVLTFNAEETYEEALSELDFMEAVSAAVPGTQVYVQDTQYVEALPAMAGHVVHAYLLIATSSIIAASLQL